MLTDCSLRLIKYLLDFGKNHIVTFGEELEKHFKDIQAFNTHPQFQYLASRLQNNIETFKSDIKNRKHKKYLRDKCDFESKQIYTWKQSNQQRHREPLYSDISESDTSGTEESHSEPYRQQNRFQVNRGRGTKRQQRGSGRTSRESYNTRQKK